AAPAARGEAELGAVEVPLGGGGVRVHHLHRDGRARLEERVRRQGQGRALGRGSRPRRRGGRGVAPAAARGDGPRGRIGNDGALVGGRLGDRVRLAPLEHHV